MAKLPTEIKRAIRKSAKAYAIATENNAIVRDYIDKALGSEYDGQRGHDYFLDQLIDSTEIGYDPEHVISFFERELPEVSK